MEYASSTAGDLAWLRAFYTGCGYNLDVDPADFVAYCHDDDATVGVGRLAVENGVVVLRGMQVLEAFRGRGLGTRLLEMLGAELHGRESYCLPYTNLLEFYGQAGFVACDISEAPAFLQERLLSYRARNLDVQLLFRAGRER